MNNFDLVLRDTFIADVSDFLLERKDHVFSKKEKKIINENNCMYRYPDCEKRYIIGTWNNLLFVLERIGIDYDVCNIVSLSSLG